MSEISNNEICEKNLNLETSRNYVDDFEKAFQNLLHILIKTDQISPDDSDSSNIKADTEQYISKFLEVAKELECFFLQKRYLLSVQKPEQLLKEDLNDLRNELNRKEQLIQKHYDKISIWQNLLSDVQSVSGTHSQSVTNASLLQTQQNAHLST